MKTNLLFQIDFASVFAEPTAAHGFDGVFKLNYVMFNQTKLWVYKILSALVSTVTIRYNL